MSDLKNMEIRYKNALDRMDPTERTAFKYLEALIGDNHRKTLAIIAEERDEDTRIEVLEKSMTQAIKTIESLDKRTDSIRRAINGVKIDDKTIRDLIAADSRRKRITAQMITAFTDMIEGLAEAGIVKPPAKVRACIGELRALVAVYLEDIGEEEATIE